MQLKQAVEICVDVDHILNLQPQGGRQRREVILFGAPFQLEASIHIVRSLLKWRESVLLGEEKRNLNLNIFAMNRNNALISKP